MNRKQRKRKRERGRQHAGSSNRARFKLAVIQGELQAKRERARRAA